MAVEADTIAYIRILIGDSPANEADRLFTNTEIALFLRLDGNNAKRAAASLLDAVAVNEVLLSKVIRTQDLSTDGSKVADVLRKQARILRDQADAEDGSDAWAFEIVDMQHHHRFAELSDTPWGL